MQNQNVESSCRTNVLRALDQNLNGPGQLFYVQCVLYSVPRTVRQHRAETTIFLAGAPKAGRHSVHPHPTDNCHRTSWDSTSTKTARIIRCRAPRRPVISRPPPICRLEAKLPPSSSSRKVRAAPPPSPPLVASESRLAAGRLHAPTVPS